MTAARDFSPGYGPGGLTTASRRKHSSRLAGLASGRKRRQLALARRGNARPGQTTGSLSYELRQPSRREFDTRYDDLYPRPERPCAATAWERGRQAVWEELMGSWRLLRARGQHCRTTNGQRGQALSLRGTPRCRRSIQLYHRKLEELGFASYLHVRKPDPNRDCLSIEWRFTARLRSSFSPPLRERRTCPTGRGSPPCSQLPNTSIPPATPAGDEPPDKPAARPDTTEKEQGGSSFSPPLTPAERIASEVRFVQLKLQVGLGPARELRERLADLEALARAAHEPAPTRPRGSDG